MMRTEYGFIYFGVNIIAALPFAVCLKQYLTKFGEDVDNVKMEIIELMYEGSILFDKSLRNQVIL